MLNCNWEKLFSGQILSRGYRYYSDGRVNMTNDISAKTVYATVSGSDEYEVEIGYGRFPQLSLKCDCPFAEDGNRCKHMAAVFYEMEDDSFDYSAKSSGATATRRKDTYGNSDRSEKSGGAGNTKSRTGAAKKVNYVYPFKDNKPGNSFEEYQYFDFSELTKVLQITEETYDKAKEFSASGRIRDSVNYSYFDEGALDYNSAVLSATMLVTKTQEEINEEKQIRKRNAYSYRYTEMQGVSDIFCVSLRITRQRITELTCGCEVCREKRGMHYGYYYGGSDPKLCEHQVALLIQVDKFIRDNHPGDGTDRTSRQVLKSFSGSNWFADAESGDSEISEKKTVSLVPMIQTDYYGIKACFRVGNDKMYIAKDLFALTDNVEKRQVMKLGKNQQIDFGKETFKDDFSSALFEMIRASVNEERARNEIMRYGYSADTSRDSILLMGHNLDTFFDICKGMRIEKRSGTKTDKGILITEDNPKLKVRIDPIYYGTKLFEGLRVTGELPEIHKGSSEMYFLDNDRVCRISQDFALILKKISSYNSNSLNLKIGRKYISDFNNNMLPVLSKIAEIENNCKELEENILPPMAVFSFYIDFDEASLPICDVKVCYGMNEYNAFDAINVNSAVSAAAMGMRDIDREKTVIEAVRKYFACPDYARKRMTCLEDDNIYELLDGGLSELMQLGEVNLSDAFKSLKIRRRPRINMGVSVKSDLLELSVESADISSEDLLLLLNSYKKKKRYFRLKNGDFMKMEDDGLMELGAMMEALHLSPREFAKGKMKLPLYRALYLDKMIEQNSGIYADRDKKFKNLVKDFKTVNESDFEVPEKLEKTLRNYQTFGFKWLRTVESCHFGGILADDMGLGKTLQIISLLLDAKLRNGAEQEKKANASPTKKALTENAEKCGTSLVVSPASLVYNWKAEFERFAPGLRVCTVTGSQAERADIISNSADWDVLVTSYDLLKRDIAEYEDINFAYEIIDEAQFIKNHNTAAAKAVKVINSRQRYALTGTPIENRLSELWSIFDYLMPGFLYGYDVFRREFETPIAKNKDKGMMEHLKRMVSPFILRRLKKDVLKDIPDKLEEVCYTKLSDEQRKVYDGEVVKIRKSLEKESDEAFGKKKMELLAELTRIREICCDPHLLFENYNGESAKKDTCLELIKSALEGEHRVLLFSQFTSMLEILEADLRQQGIGYYKIIGSTPKEQRIQLVNDFNDGKDNVNVFLISLKAGGTGLNLTGADVVIHYDPWWNVAAQNQATDRAHRIGQTKVVSVYRIIAKDTIEEKILKMQEDKKNLADNVLSGETGGLVGMSREDVLELLR